jgi:hypothetical protein
MALPPFSGDKSPAHQSISGDQYRREQIAPEKS